MLEALPGFPDAYFIEDAAVVTPETAVLARSGAPARRKEGATMEDVLAKTHRILRIKEPGTLDGGDVIEAGHHVLIGLSERTDEAGARQLGDLFESLGMTWATVLVGDGLHLKSSVNYLGGRRLLVTSDFAGREELSSFDLVQVAPGEDYAANSLWINEVLLMPAGYPQTRARVEALGIEVRELDMSEARKMDGGLTCLSLRWGP